MLIFLAACSMIVFPLVLIASLAIKNIPPVQTFGECVIGSIVFTLLFALLEAGFWLLFHLKY